MKIIVTAISERQHARFIYAKSKKIANPCVHKIIDTFQKAKQFPSRFYIQIAWHFTLRDSHDKFYVGIFIQKAWHFALRDVFIYKTRHFTKSRIICVTLLYTKPRTLCIMQFFIEFLKLAERGGHFYIKKQCTLHCVFICKKQCT